MADIKLYTLISLFENFQNGEAEDAAISKIEIPIIQRDYAQGRRTPQVKRIREKFVKSLKEALLPEGKGTTLDFVYGYRNEKGILIPLDGQQRLTTLFLLHWYIARHEGVEDTAIDFLHNFSYATRASAREFCQNLVDYTPNFKSICVDASEYKLSEEIADQHWMPIDWMHDPTIASMLEMLDCLHEHFKDTNGLWQQLENGRISFYFLPIDQMGLTDDLYIKMNSRGKPLTEFEHFKAEWESCIKTVDEDLAKTVSHKIDTEWTDLLWDYRNVNNDLGDNIIDEEFVAYFLYLCDILYYKHWQMERKENLLDIAHQLFSKECPEAKDNIQFIIDGFDCWNNVDDDICELFDSFLNNSGKHEKGKAIVRMRNDEDIDLFRECCAKYGNRLVGGHIRAFSLLRSALLYAFVFYLKNFDKITEEQFRRRLRIVNNLIKGSEFEMRDREDNMKNTLDQIEHILLHGSICQDPVTHTAFNINQLKEEEKKIEYIAEHPEDADTIFELEDHELLNGAIRVLGIENIALAEKFVELFNCDRGLVHCALLTIGDYSQKVTFRYEMGAANRALNWRDLFRNDIEKIKVTKQVLVELLNSKESFSNEVLIEIIEKYLTICQAYDWRYYFVKYTKSLNTTYNMYFWYNHKETEKKSYKILMMYTEKSLTGRNHNVFLKAIYDRVISLTNAAIKLEDYAYQENGGKLLFVGKDCYLTCDEACFSIYSNDVAEPTKQYPIEQNAENGLDCTDRVELGVRIVLEQLGVSIPSTPYGFEYEPAKPINDDGKGNATRSDKTRLKVFLPSGIIIDYVKAKESFVEAIKLAGVDNVRKLGLTRCNVPLVSSTKDDYYNQVEAEPGVWIITHSSTKEKKRTLETISEQLGLNWIVKIVNKDS